MMFLYDLFGKPFGWIMYLIYHWVDNYALAILIFTIVTKLLLFPISYKQQKNSSMMQRINPKMEKLRKKHKDDPKKLQEAQMQLYQEEHINPGASCLPMFLQFFILFGVLDVVYKPLSHIMRMGDGLISKATEVVTEFFPAMAKQGTNLREELVILNANHQDPDKFSSVFAGTGFSEKMADFYDKFSLFGVNLGAVPSWKPEEWNYTSVILFLIPIFSGLLQLILTVYMQFVQKKRNPAMKGMGCMNGMLYIMPIFSVWFAFSVPAGVGFYWICSSFFSLIQTIGLNLYFTTDRIAKMGEIEKQKMQKKYAGGKRSLIQRMMEQQQEPSEVMQKRESYEEETKELSRSELSKYHQQMLKDARRKMAEKYGEEFSDDSGNEK